MIDLVQLVSMLHSLDFQSLDLSIFLIYTLRPMNFLKYINLFIIIPVGFIQPFYGISNIAINSENDSIQIFSVDQKDLDEDGLPDLTIIACTFATENDRVLVYDQNGDMSKGNIWYEITDFRDDIWIFDVGADGTAQLILVFEVVDEKHTVMIYDDISGDGQVNYQIVGDRVIIEESDFWHIKVETKIAWDVQKGVAFTKLIFLIDGYAGLGRGVGRIIDDQNQGIDGIVDWHLEYGDKDGDGIIDYQIQRATSPFLLEYDYAGLHKTVIFSKISDSKPVPYENIIFWPLLTSKHYYEEYRYFDHPPAIAIDWETGTIDLIGNLGFPIENGYHIYSRLPLEKGTINPVNFENPMAYYDMAADQDGWAELQVRFDVAVPYDPYFPYTGGVKTPNVEVNVSWDQDNDNRWDYKMNLAANDPIEEIVTFPDFAVKSVPYEEIVPWVLDHTWDIAMLVQDYQPRRDSEGMFGKGWMVHRGYADEARIEPSWVKREYMMGFSSQPPTEYYQDIQEGMRGEYSFQYFDTPRIYLSTIDRQLHLHAAEKGVWNLGDRRYLRYVNLDEDAYLDQWREERNGSMFQQLNYYQGMLVFCGNGRVRIKPVDIEPSLLETQPPGSHETWSALWAELDRYQPTFAPDDLEAMLAQFEGPELSIAGASLRDFRLAGEGFRFILKLESNFSIDGPDLIGLYELAPGEYVVAYDGAGFTVRSLTPAAANLADLHLEAETGDPPHLGQWASLRGELRNEGLADLHDLEICAHFSGPLGETEVLTTTVNLLGGETSQALDLPWALPSEGTWQIKVGSDCQDDEGVYQEPSRVLASTTIDIQPPEGPPNSWLLTLGGMLTEMSAWLLVMFYAAIALLAGVSAFLWARANQAGDQSEEKP